MIRYSKSSNARNRQSAEFTQKQRNKHEKKANKNEKSKKTLKNTKFRKRITRNTIYC